MRIEPNKKEEDNNLSRRLTEINTPISGNVTSIYVGNHRRDDIALKVKCQSELPHNFMLKNLTANCLGDIILRQSQMLNPIVQIIEVKKVEKGGKTHYRAAISDGSNYTPASINSALAPMFENGSITDFTLIRLLNYNYNTSGQRPVFFISKAEVVGQETASIGNPQKINHNSTPSASAGPVETNQKPPAAVPSAIPPKPTLYSNVDESNIIPIDTLTSYLNSWTIRAKIIKKGAIREFPKAGQPEPTRILNIVLQDKDGSQIQGTFFGREALNFNQTLEANKVYTVTGGHIKLANKKFNPTKHDYEITFGQSTQFNEVADDNSIGGITYHFVPIDQIEPKKNTSCDVIGRIMSVDTVNNFTSKAGKEMTNRKVEIVDTTRTKIQITLWNDQARDFAGQEGDIIAISSASVSDFGGVTLSLNCTASFELNPAIADAKIILDWWSANGDSTEIHSLSNSAAGSGSSTQELFLSLVMERSLGLSTERGDYFSIYGNVDYISMKRRPFYLACPNADCKFRGLEANPGGEFFCRHCSNIVANPVPRAQLNFTVADFSGSAFMSVLGDDDMLATVTGKTAKEWYDEIGTGEPDDKDAGVRARLFMPLRLRIRAKADDYQGTSRTKFTVMQLRPVDFADAAKFYATEIRKYSAI